MTKISKETKYKAILEYENNEGGKFKIAEKYGISPRLFGMLIAAYQQHGPAVLFNPPTVTPEFRVKVARWAISHNASLTEVAAKFGYCGTAQILNWKKIYSQKGPNGLLSLKKGRTKNMPKRNDNQPKKLSERDNDLARLKDENLRLKIENEALKLLASIRQQTKNSHK